MSRYVAILGFLLASGLASAADAPLLSALPARNIGPANMGGRICDIEAVESDPRTFYVGSANGGLWKTRDRGDTWESLFDQQATLSIGDVAIAPSDPNIVYVGTGEANPRNSVSWGNGVYKSTDAGKTWQYVGLKETQHIGRIVVHPRNPDIVYVAALGRIWGPNKERGLYKSTDGGKTWSQSKYIDEKTGFIDVAIDPSEPEILYAAAWEVRRGPFSGGNPEKGWGAGSGLFRTTDAGKTWEKMTEGLPRGELGRCGFSIYRKDPKIVYAVVQSDRTTITVAGQLPKAGNDPAIGGVFRSEDKGKTWKKLNDLCPRPFYYGQIRVDPSDDQRIYVLGVTFFISEDGGKNFKPQTFPMNQPNVVRPHADHHALWIDPKDSNSVLLGNDGGIYRSKDRTKTWEHLRGMPLAQFYGVAVDMQKPYRVYGGLQDNGSWGGPVATDSTEGITTAHWLRIGGGDGFQCMIDPTDANTVYYESQYGNFQRRDVKAAKSKPLKPVAPKGEPLYRFNWNSPMVMSPHDPKTIYYGGNHVFKSTDRGDTWKVISKDLTRGTPGPSKDSGNTLTVLTESPMKAGLLYAGSDDGKLHVTKDGGETWTDLTNKIPDVGVERWMTKVECSSFDEGTAYLTFDRHRQDDRKPYLFKTTDHGQTWTLLTAGLPADAPVHVVRESSKNRNLLFAGTEFGLFVTLDAGKNWQRMSEGMPPHVTVNDLVIHPRERDLVVGTHARGVYIVDIGPLEDLTDKVRATEFYVCNVRPVRAVTLKAPEQPLTSRSYRAPNPPIAATVYYHQKSDNPVSLTISDKSGKELVTLTGPGKAGLQVVQWDLKAKGSKELVAPGTYTVVVKSGKETATRTITVETP